MMSFKTNFIKLAITISSIISHTHYTYFTLIYNVLSNKSLNSEKNQMVMHHGNLIHNVVTSNIPIYF